MTIHYITTRKDGMRYLATDTESTIVAQGRTEDEAIEILGELLNEYYKTNEITLIKTK